MSLVLPAPAGVYQLVMYFGLAQAAAAGPAHDLLQRVERRQRSQPVLQHPHRLVRRRQPPAPQQRERAPRVVARDAEGVLGLVRVEAEVDEARNVMQGNISAMLANSEQLTALQSKTDDIAHDSRDFYRDARTSRRQMQCAEYRNRLVAIVVGMVLFLFFFGGWIFGTDEHHLRPHIPPSPPPPSDE